jgi:methylenetetrahydrofolate reductase (NADPH)
MVNAAVKDMPSEVTHANGIRDALVNGQFFWTLEFIPSVDQILRDALNKLEPLSIAVNDTSLLAGFSVTDRVHSDRDPDPVAAASHLMLHSGKQPLVHWSGKGRDITDLHAALGRMADNGLENMLILTGDRLKETAIDRRPRYLESVCAVAAAKQLNPQLLVAVALNPFKYREEDCMAQYLKLGKKVGAGADFVITQLGLDMQKFEEACGWVEQRNYQVPLVANLMPVLARSARYMRKHQLAGVTITDSFLTLLEEEEKLLDKGVGRAMRRLALQIIGLRFMGYAGVQLTGIHTLKQLEQLEAQVTALSDLCQDQGTWCQAWEECMTFPDGGQVEAAPRNAWYMSDQKRVHTPAREQLKYRFMDHVHDFLFGNGLGAHLLGPLMKPIKPRHGSMDHLTERFEWIVKHPLFGCETCGMCRLEATQYVCPETCPKGLANGPCGGTTENLCEFRDRECIHSVKYRIAKDAGVLDQLESWLIPPVPAEIRHSSSYPPHFRGEGVKIHVVKIMPRQSKQEN